MNVIEIITNIASGLFCIERQDRICISFETHANIKPVQDFLIGQSYTYGDFTCREINLVGGKDYEPVMELLCWLKSKKQDPYCIYFVNMTGTWTDDQLRDLYRREDLFKNLQMIFLVRENDLKNYLRLCPELCCVFRRYKLCTQTLLGGEKGRDLKKH